MKVYSFEEVKDDIIGKGGPPERDEYEREVQQALHACRVSSERNKQSLTNNEIGESDCPVVTSPL